MCGLPSKAGGSAPVTSFPNQGLIDALSGAIEPITAPIPNAIVIGALGRVAQAMLPTLKALGIPVTKWDMPETQAAGHFPKSFIIHVLTVFNAPERPCLCHHKWSIRTAPFA